MMSTALRRTGTSSVGGRAAASARRGLLAFLGGASSFSGAAPRSRWATSLSVAAQSVPSLKVHKRDSAQHPAYDVIEEDFVAEYGATTTLYKHKKSGAEVLSVQIDDDNKVSMTLFYFLRIGIGSESLVCKVGLLKLQATWSVVASVTRVRGRCN